MVDYALPPPEPRPLPEWSIFVRNAALERIAQIDDFETADLTSRFNAVGQWQLTLDRRQPASAALFIPGNGIEVTRDGDPFIAGPMTGRKAVRDERTNQATITGLDDMVWLKRRLAYPQPATVAPPYSTSEHDVRIGVASTVLRGYVDANAGPGALSVRRVTGLTVGTDPLIGSTITGRGRWQVLLDLLTELALSGGGLGFGITQSGTTLQFGVYQPVDRAAAVKFSEGLGNLASFTYDGQVPGLTYAVVGGGGEGTARTIVEASDGDGIAAGWGRIEQFIDRRDTTDTTEMGQKASEALTDGAEKVTLGAVPVDSDSLAYGQDYNLGDRVTLVLDDVGTEVTELIREVTVKLTPDSQRLTPTIGTPGRHDLLRVIGSVRDHAARIRDLERR